MIYDDVSNILQLYTEVAARRYQVTTQSGDKLWFMGSMLHREDGPAVEHNIGTRQYWLYHKPYDSAESWAKAVLKSKNKPSDETSVEAFLHNLNKKKVNELM